MYRSQPRYELTALAVGG